jgi:hypothetical protein
MKMTIGKRIVAGFGLTILITCGLGTFAYTRLSAVETHTQSIVNDSLPGGYLSGEIHSIAAENYGRLLTHVLAEDAKDMTAIEAELTAGIGHIDQVMKKYEATITADRDRQLFAAVQSTRAAYRTVMGDVLPLSRALKTKEATEVVNRQLKPAYERYAAACTALAEYNRTSGEESGRRTMGAVDSGQNGVLWASVRRWPCRP